MSLIWCSNQTLSCGMGVGGWLPRLRPTSEMMLNASPRRAHMSILRPFIACRASGERLIDLSCARPRTRLHRKRDHGQMSLDCWGLDVERFTMRFPLFVEAAPVNLFDKSLLFQRLRGLKRVIPNTASCRNNGPRNGGA